MIYFSFTLTDQIVSKLIKNFIKDQIVCKLVVPIKLK